MTMIRRARPEDTARMVELAFMEYAEERAFLTGLNFSFLDVFTEMMNVTRDHKLGSNVIAEHPDEGIVGIYCCRYVPSFADHKQIICHEAGWYVLPEYRGQGYGKAMRAETARLALELGVQFIKVGTTTTTEEGRTLLEWYKKDGYIPFQVESFKRLTKEDTEP